MRYRQDRQELVVEQRTDSLRNLDVIDTPVLKIGISRFDYVGQFGPEQPSSSHWRNINLPVASLHCSSAYSYYRWLHTFAIPAWN
jgi:hypothetical protein